MSRFESLPAAKVCRSTFVLVAVVVLQTILLPASAQEVAIEEAEDAAAETYYDLLRSDDRSTRAIAERYFNLVKRQEWTDATGKATTMAKYVEHDPDLQWVKLRTSKGSGNVPLAKLSKTCQSRVRQIAVLQKRLDELLAAGTEAEADGGSTRGRDAFDDHGSPMPDERGSEPVAIGREQRPEARAFEARPQAPRPNFGELNEPKSASADFDPDPLGFAKVDLGTAPPGLPPGAVPPLGRGPGAAPEAAALEPIHTGRTGGDTWRTSYEAFRANISVETLPIGQYRINWGPMRELQEAYDFYRRAEDSGSVGEEEQTEIGKRLDAAGEFTWETTLCEAPVNQGDWSERLGLPRLPEPLELSFVLDPDRDPGRWQDFEAGDRVRFTGRFIWFSDTDELQVGIRNPEG